MAETEVIRLAPLNDGSEEDCQCARCGSSVMWISCERCGGDGYVEDSGWDDDYGLDDAPYPCGDCATKGGWRVCMSLPGISDKENWCKDHPLPGREHFTNGEVEWFSISRPTEDSKA